MFRPDPRILGLAMIVLSGCDYGSGAVPIGDPPPARQRVAAPRPPSAMETAARMMGEGGEEQPAGYPSSDEGSPEERAGSRSASEAPRAGSDSATKTAAAPMPAGPVIAAGLRINLPEAWQRQRPSSSMRLAQAAIPGEAGEASLTVFHFGVGGGGGVEENLARWEGQLQIAAGVTPEREQMTLGVYKVHLTELNGTLAPSGFGMGPSSPVAGARLLGAVVEGEGGPWFFKVTGPEATVRGNRAAFLDMLSGLSPAS